LLLSKIENRQFIEKENIQLNALINRITESYQNQAYQRRLVMEVINSTPVSLETNSTLIETLISNLISNAVRFSAPGGSISLELTPASLSIKNSGAPFDAPEKIFERFHRESKTSSGSGLGLAIVKSICEALRFRITYHYQDNGHYFVP
jgi:signal transduction histidine kinase